MVAHGWGKPAVVGWSAMTFVEGGISVDDMRIIFDGAIVSIDGETGEIFAGTPHETRLAPRPSP